MGQVVRNRSANDSTTAHHDMLSCGSHGYLAAMSQVLDRNWASRVSLEAGFVQHNVVPPGQHGAELQLIEGACRPLGHRDDRSIPGSTGCSPTMDLSEKDAARSKWKLTQKRRQGRGRGSGAPSGRGRRGARAGGGAANDLGSNEDRCACRHRPPPPVPLPSALLLQNRLPLLQPADLLYLILSYHALPVLLQVPGCRGGGRGSRGGAGPCAAVGGR